MNKDIFWAYKIWKRSLNTRELWKIKLSTLKSFEVFSKEIKTIDQERELMTVFGQ
jgi:hypothetical protein